MVEKELQSKKHYNGSREQQLQEDEKKQKSRDYRLT
jgi:hypothetical protein